MRGLPSRSAIGDCGRDQRITSRRYPSGRLSLKTGIPKLDRLFKFKNFKDAIAFTDAVGEEAEKEGHHPRLTTEWGKVAVTWWTHKIRNLHRNDFIMAAKTDRIYQGYTDS